MWDEIFVVCLGAFPGIIRLHLISKSNEGKLGSNSQWHLMKLCHESLSALKWGGEELRVY